MIFGLVVTVSGKCAEIVASAARGFTAGKIQWKFDRGELICLRRRRRWNSVLLMKKYDSQALKTVLTLIAGATVLAFLQRLGTENKDYQTVATAMYPIGLFFGWGIPVLFKWDTDERAAEREAAKDR